MAQWTDPSRTFLIQEIRNKRIIWDKDASNEDTTKKAAKAEAFAEVADSLNEAFPGPQKYTCEEIRSQWKNLKDTFVRKQRYINEGKYAYDAQKEITWKFYKMLSFLDDSKKKTTENNGADHPIFDIAALQREHGLDLVKSEVHFENSNHSASSSEELMQSLFVQSYKINQEKEKSPHQSDTTSSPNRMPRVSQQSSPDSYPPSTSKNNVSSSGDEEEEPRRKKARETADRRRPFQICRRVMVAPPSTSNHDEFEIFGQLIAAQLRRTAEENSRSESLRLQKKLNDVLFEAQISLLER